ncbi:hypothetical protein ES708_13715 [subsurface metagenome]
MREDASEREGSGGVERGEMNGRVGCTQAAVTLPPATRTLCGLLARAVGGGEEMRPRTAEPTSSLVPGCQSEAKGVAVRGRRAEFRVRRESELGQA